MIAQFRLARRLPLRYNAFSFMHSEVQNIGHFPRNTAYSWLTVAVLAAAAGAVLVPVLVLGFPKGNDLEFHLPVWIDVLHQWKEHIFSLRWAALAQYGFGQPIFCFYPPLSYYLGAAISAAAGWSAAAAAYVFIVLTLSGAAMLRFAGQFIPRRHALMAAVLYECNPFQVFRIYHSSAFAEMLAGAFLPLLILFTLDLICKKNSSLQLAVVFAAIWLTNLPVGIMSTYSLIVLIIALAVSARSARVLFRGGFSMLLGFGLSAFHLLPGALEQSWINLHGLDIPDLLPESNFLPAWGYDPDVKWFAPILSCMVFWGLTAGAVAVLASRKRRVPTRGVLVAVIVLCVFSSAMMFFFSAPAWVYLPKMRLIQFPWRWMLVFEAGISFLLAMALPANIRKSWSAVIVFVGISLSTLVITADYWHPGVGAEIYNRISKEHGYYGRPEYMPPGIDQASLWPIYNAPLVSEYRGAEAQHRPESLHVLRWSPEEKKFSVRSSEGRTLALRLQFYPAWKVEVNGNKAKTAMEPSDGRLLVTVPAGFSIVKIGWETTPARKAGISISILSLVFAVFQALRSSCSHS